MRKNLKCFLGLSLIIVFVFSISSCANSKKLSIFSGLQNDSSSIIQKNKNDNTIKSGDILQITVFCLDEETKRILNNLTTATVAGGSSNSPGYLVNDSGFIKFPMLGYVKCSGLLKEQLEEQIKTTLLANKFVLDPIVTVRIANFKITILGEVNRPGVINIPNEKINIIEAIGLAGDLTIFAKSDNILLIREVNGKRIYKRFSLNDPDLFAKEFYNLQNQDVIYIEPTKKKAASLDRSGQFISLGLTAVNMFILIYTQFLLN